MTAPLPRLCPGLLLHKFTSELPALSALQGNSQQWGDTVKIGFLESHQRVDVCLLHSTHFSSHSRTPQSKSGPPAPVLSPTMHVPHFPCRKPTGHKLAGTGGFITERNPGEDSEPWPLPPGLQSVRCLLSTEIPKETQNLWKVTYLGLTEPNFV